MRTKVRRLAEWSGILMMGVALLGGTVARAEPSAPSPNVKSRLHREGRSGEGAARGHSLSPRATVWVAPAATPERIRAAHGAFAPATENARESDRIVSVVVKLGGRRPRPVATNADSVRELLRAMRVGLGKRDLLEPRLKATLSQGTSVRVVRIRRERQRVSVALPFATETKYSDDMDRGERRIETLGVPGWATRIYEVTFRNGRAVSRRLIARRVLASPVTQVVVVGTRDPVPDAAAAAPTGRVQYGEAVWYDTHGMVAAHKTLPFGTRVTVTNLDNGRSVTVVINDRGPYTPGRIIDLSPEAFSVIAPLGQGVVRARISW